MSFDPIASFRTRDRGRENERRPPRSAFPSSRRRERSWRGTNNQPKGVIVEGMQDKVEGKFKEAEGKLTDDELREKEGEAQQKVGEGKEKLEEAEDDLRDRS
jgi:uncharacterized protein YjbJ (UPF0337 family)